MILTILTFCLTSLDLLSAIKQGRVNSEMGCSTTTSKTHATSQSTLSDDDAVSVVSTRSSSTPIGYGGCRFRPKGLVHIDWAGTSSCVQGFGRIDWAGTSSRAQTGEKRVEKRQDRP